MKQPFSKRWRFMDIRHPNESEPDTEVAPPVSDAEVRELLESIPPAPASPKYSIRSGGWLKKTLFVCAFLLLAGGCFAAIRVHQLKQKLSSSAAESIQIFQAALSDLRSLNFHNAEVNADNGNAELRKMSGNLTPFQSFLTSKLGDGFFPLLSDIGQSYKDFQNISAAAYALVEDVKELESFLPGVFHGQNGDKFIANLEAIEQNLGMLSDASARLVSASSRLKGILPIEPGDYLSLQLDLARARNLMDALVPWLKSPEAHRLAVFLGNPSEIRPGGGFTGSYAEITIQGGSVKSIDVYDISYADKELNLKTIPPQPLQALVKNWRAADANWFFDFSDSAKKTLSFLEASEVYKKNKVTFDGAIGISAKVIRDLLAVTGPIDANGTAITSENFLTKIQSEVQAGHDVGSPNSKQILKDLTPLLVDRLTNLPEDKYKALGGVAKDWIAKKDLMLYAKDATFERFIDSYQAGGKVAALGSDWNGDYLAVVNANIGGGKTDLFVKQKIVLQSQISTQGELDNHLVITRSHTATAADPWWYHETNQEYVQVFTPPDAQLSFAEGGFAKKISPALNYTKEGYLADPDVSALETTKWEHLSSPGVVSLRAAGKNVFATWSRTAMGASTDLTFEYSRKLPAPPADGQTFEFIFEKQAAAQGEYEFEITAPVGFRFRENGLPIFNYKTNDPVGRLVLDLTLEKI